MQRPSGNKKDKAQGEAGAEERSARSRGADVAQQILRKATELFADRGFVGASLADIAQAVGIRKPSLLYHFTSKDELRRKVLENMLVRWNESLPNLLMAAASGREQFEAVLSETVRFFAADPDRAKLLLRETLDREEEMMKLLDNYVRPWTSVVCDYIRKGQEQGRISAALQPEYYVIQIINLVVASMATSQTMAPLRPPGADENDRREESQEDVETEDKGRILAGGPSKAHIDELIRVARTSLFIGADRDESTETSTPA